MSQAFKDWYVSGLQALISANKIGEQTTQKLFGCVTAPELKQALEKGHKSAQQHAETLQKLLQDAKGEQGEIPNDVMQGIDSAATKIADSHDPDVRDAGVITSAQIALHYYMAAYGGMASTAKHLGLTEQAQTFARLNDEIKQADQAYTKMAEETTNPQAQAA